MKGKVFLSQSPSQTEAHARKIAKRISRYPTLLLLKGEVGAGKTVWTRALIKALLGKDTVVQSPSYSLVNHYQSGDLKIYHADLYRLESEDDLESTGLWDLLQKKSIMVIEWADKISARWPDEVHVMNFEFRVVDEENRQIL